MHLSMRELHQLGRIGWLRAAVLGANDGIISVASLLMGVAAARISHMEIFITGLAALVAGAMSMAAGEYISVSSQADMEKAEILREQMELATDISAEIEELTTIYVNRGLEPKLAAQVAEQLMAKDPLETHLRDELGLGKNPRTPQPVQAALFSAGSFALGALLPILVTLWAPNQHVAPAIFITAILFLALLGAIAAKIGGSSMLVGLARVTLWGTGAMLVTALIGALVGVVI